MRPGEGLECLVDQLGARGLALGLPQQEGEGFSARTRQAEAGQARRASGGRHPPRPPGLRAAQHAGHGLDRGQPGPLVEVVRIRGRQGVALHLGEDVGPAPGPRELDEHDAGPLGLVGAQLQEVTGGVGVPGAALYSHAPRRQRE